MNEDAHLDWSWETRIEPIWDFDNALDREHDDEDEDDGAECDCERRDWANGFGSDGEVDGDALASAGFGTDEDYGYFGDCDEF